MEYNLEDIIFFSLEVFSRLFKFDLNCVFAELDINTSTELKKSFSMGYFHPERTIGVNPLLLEQYKDENYTEEQIFCIIFSLIAHEYRHAWQHTIPDFELEWKNYKIFDKSIDEYLIQKVEIDAYSFQEACFWIMSGDMNHHLAVPEVASDIIHSLAYQYYEQYHIDIEKIIKGLSKEYAKD